MLGRLDELAGGRVRVEWEAGLRVRGRRLHTGEGPGQEVHAAAFPRERRLVLDRGLLNEASELERILLHEMHHFVWPRLGNPLRQSWGAVLEEERRRKARGELGWSAEWRKQRLGEMGTRRWREYACESFCDTAAWVYGRAAHPEQTLAAGHRARRRAWFEALPERFRI